MSARSAALIMSAYLGCEGTGALVLVALGGILAVLCARASQQERRNSSSTCNGARHEWRVQFKSHAFKTPLPPWRGESRGVRPRTNQRTGCDGVRITPGLGDWSGDSKGQGRTQGTRNHPPGLGPIDALERDAVSLAGRNESEGGPDHMLPDEPDRRVPIRPLWGLEGPVPRRSGRGSKGVTTPGCVIVQ